MMEHHLEFAESTDISDIGSLIAESEQKLSTTLCVLWVHLLEWLFIKYPNRGINLGAVFYPERNNDFYVKIALAID